MSRLRKCIVRKMEAGVRLMEIEHKLSGRVFSRYAVTSLRNVDRREFTSLAKARTAFDEEVVACLPRCRPLRGLMSQGPELLWSKKQKTRVGLGPRGCQAIPQHQVRLIAGTVPTGSKGPQRGVPVFQIPACDYVPINLERPFKEFEKLREGWNHLANRFMTEMMTGDPFAEIERTLLAFLPTVHSDRNGGPTRRIPHNPMFSAKHGGRRGLMRF